MKGLLFGLIFATVLVAGAVGVLVYKNLLAEKGVAVNEITKTVDEAKPLDTTKPPVVVEEPRYGEVRGKLCFPSEGVPALTVYLKNTVTGAVLSVDTPAYQSNPSYSIDNVPAGSYMAFAYTKQGNLSGGYTPAVPCGLSVNCNDHTLTVIQVQGGGLAQGIDICDWYGAVVPPKPVN